MKLIDTLTLNGTSLPTQDKLNQGQLEGPPNRKLVGLRLIIAAAVNNTTGGALASGLTEARKLALLRCLEFNVAWGKNRVHRVFQTVDGDRIRREMRFAYGTEVEGWSNATDGLTRNMNNGVATAVRFTLVIPLGKMWRLKKDIQRIFGMGQTQQKTLEVEVRRVSNAIDTNLTLDSATPVTIQMEPHYEACNGDLVGCVPEYRQLELAKDAISFDVDGLPLRLSERTAAADASTLANINVEIDDDVVIDQRPARSITELYRDDPLETTTSFLGDQETVLYQPSIDADFDELNTGVVKFRQNGTRVVATPLLSLLVVPYKDSETIRNEIAHQAVVSEKTVLASSADLWAGLKASKRHQGLPAWTLHDSSSREFKSRPGLAAAVGGKAQLYIPPVVQNAARAQRARFASDGDTAGAANVTAELAAIIPGAVPSGRGFARGDSPTFREVAAVIG